MNIVETAYDMPTGMLLHEAGRQFAMAELVRDDWQRALYERGGWFLLLVWAERTCGVPADGEAWEQAARDVLANPRPIDKIRRDIADVRERNVGVSGTQGGKR